MIAAHWQAKLAALVGALLIHGGIGISIQPTKQDVQLEAASGSVSAQLGAGFADLVTGVQAPPAEPAVTPHPKISKPPEKPILETIAPPEMHLDSPPLQQLPTLDLQEIRTKSLPEQLPKPPQISALPTAVSDLADPLRHTVSPAIVPLAASSPSIALPVATAPSLSELSSPDVPTLTDKLLEPTKAKPPVSKTVTAATAVDDGPPRVSLRPRSRPRTLKIKKITPPKRITKQVVSKKPPIKSGNARSNQRAGSETGTTKARQKTQAGKGKKASQGNAAISNYPGQVQRRISRVRRPKVRARGVVHVSFSIAANGSIASIRVSKSSGSPELDQAALKAIQRAAPFPPPPAGAKRKYNIQVRGR